MVLPSLRSSVVNDKGMGITRGPRCAFITPYSKTKEQKYFKFAPRTFEHFGKITTVCGQDY